MYVFIIIYILGAIDNRTKKVEKNQIPESAIITVVEEHSSKN